MRTRVKLLVLTLVVLMLNVTGAFAQEETPPVEDAFAQTATAIIEARTGTPSPTTAEATAAPAEEATIELTEEAPVEVTAEATIAPVEEATVEATEEAAVELTETATATPTPTSAEDDAAARGLPLGVLLVGAVAVLLIGTVVLVRENPRSLDVDDEV